MDSPKEDCFHLGVKALIRNREGQLLLLQKIQPSKYWDIPGGRLHKGETLKDTLARELREEIGLNNLIEVHPVMMILTDIRIPVHQNDVGLIFSVFRCDLSFPFEPKLSEEHVHFTWSTPLQAAQKLSLQYPPEFIEKLSQM